MTRCLILKPFPYSYDGIKSVQALKGAFMDIPAALVPGLEAEKYIVPDKPRLDTPELAEIAAKAISAAPENKMYAAPENKFEPGTLAPANPKRAPKRRARKS